MSLYDLLGQTIGEYHIETLLGAGQATAAYQGIHVKTQERVIITTLLLPEKLVPETRHRFFQRFTHLAEALASLPPNQQVLAVLGFGEHHGLPYLVTERVESSTIATLLKQQGAAPLTIGLTLLQQVAYALHFAHTYGVIHGNLTPATIVLRHEGNIQLVGLGLREMVEARDLLPSTQPPHALCNLWGAYLGDPRYLAPECVLGQRPDRRSDLYALGLLLYEVLSGVPAVSGEGKTYLDIAGQHMQYDLMSLDKKVPMLPSGGVQLLNRLLARNPDDRLQSAADVAQACQALLQKSEPLAVSSGSDYSQQREARLLPDIQVESFSLQPRGSTPPAAISLDQLSSEQVRDLVNEIETHMWDGYLLPVEKAAKRGWKTWMTLLLGGPYVETY